MEHTAPLWYWALLCIAPFVGMWIGNLHGAAVLRCEGRDK